MDVWQGLAWTAGIAVFLYLLVRMVYAFRPPEAKVDNNRFLQKKKKDELVRLPKPSSGTKYLFRLARESERRREGRKGKTVERKDDVVGLEAKFMASRPPFMRPSENGYYGVNGLDDGFIHLSTMAQVEQTARLYFKGVDDLMLLKFATATLEKDEGLELRWEAAQPPQGVQPRDEAFPHVYATERGVKAKISWWDLVECIPLKLGSDGEHIFPPGALSEADVATPAWSGTFAAEAAGATMQAEREKDELDKVEEELRKEMALGDKKAN